MSNTTLDLWAELQGEAERLGGAYGDLFMSKVTSQIYRIVVPKFIRKRILARKLRNSILNYYNNLPESPDEEVQKVLNYLHTNPIAVFPYHFQIIVAI